MPDFFNGKRLFFTFMHDIKKHIILVCFEYFISIFHFNAKYTLVFT